MVLRNMSPLLRRWHMHMFAWTGKITLETYILQFHIWMKTTGVNGSPKHLMVRRRRRPPAARPPLDDRCGCRGGTGPTSC
jgi:hypothetical protein